MPRLEKARKSVNYKVLQRPEGALDLEIGPSLEIREGPKEFNSDGDYRLISATY